MGGRLRFRWMSVCALALLLASCDAFDRGRLMAPSAGGQSGSGGSGGPDGGDSDAGPCVPRAELCNGVDEDCDGLDDVEDEDARLSCEAIIVNSVVGCGKASNGDTVCARIRCKPGFVSCDGDPSNGCEEPIGECGPCMTCEDAGDDDAGE